MEEAVLFLGFEVTASIVLSLEAISRFEKVQPLHQFTEQVWAHSQTLAELSRKICQEFGENRAACDQAYLTGLLHDIGKLVLAQNFPKEYRQVLRKAAEEKRPLTEMEQEALGVSHSDAGAYLLAVWGLPVTLFQGVAFHHSPSESYSGELSSAAAVHLAEEILESGKAVDEIISTYPAALRLERHAEAIRALAPKRAKDERPTTVTNVVRNGEADLQTAAHA